MSARADTTMIRFATEADAGMLAVLHAQGFAQAWSEADFAAFLRNPTCLCLLAGEGAAPAGFVLARLAADDADIVTIAVAAEARRQGLGSALMQAMERALALRGARRIVLEVGVDNVPARALYVSRGYAEVGRRKAYYAPSGGDALLMARTLT